MNGATAASAIAARVCSCRRAVGAVGFDSTAATWGAWLLVIGLAMQAAGVTLNWITHIVFGTFINL